MFNEAGFTRSVFDLGRQTLLTLGIALAGIHCSDSDEHPPPLVGGVGTSTPGGPEEPKVGSSDTGDNVAGNAATSGGSTNVGNTGANGGSTVAGAPSFAGAAGRSDGSIGGTTSSAGTGFGFGGVGG